MAEAKIKIATHYVAIVSGAEDEVRTRDLQLGKLSLYQLSYFRMRTANVRACRLLLKLFCYFPATFKYLPANQLSFIGISQFVSNSALVCTVLLK